MATSQLGAQPDEEVPRLIAAAQRGLDDRARRWLSRATVAVAVAAGWTLLLPWSFGDRLGLTVWRLGFEEHPALCGVWGLGTAATVAALLLPDRRRAAAATATTALAALVFTGWAWSSDGVELTGQSWTGPGPALAGITGLLWFLAALGQLVTSRTPEAQLFTEYAIRDATGRLRRTRHDRPTGEVRLQPGQSDHPRE